MRNYLNDAQRANFRNRLRQRLVESREEVRLTLLRSDDEQYQELAGGVHDVADQSLADLLVDVNLADIDRHIDEIRAIEAALLRIGRGGYGTCVDCEGEVGIARLIAEPTALRCTTCQTVYERTHVQPGHPTL